jgi:hypothetical protein
VVQEKHAKDLNGRSSNRDGKEELDLKNVLMLYLHTEAEAR